MSKDAVKGRPGENHSLGDALQDDRLNLFATAFRSSAAGIVLLTLDGVIVDANEAYCAILKYSRDQLIGHTAVALGIATEEDRNKALAAFESEGGPTRPMEFRIRCRDGEFRDVLFTNNEIEINHVGYRVATVIDITARKQAEQEREQLREQLLQAQKMESVGRLAGGLAHDFNNMLAVIAGYAESILETMDDSDPLWEQVKQISEAGHRSANLTRQLLAFSRMQTLLPTITNINDAIENFHKMLGRVIREDIILDMVLSPGIGNVKIDLGKLEQAIMNLVVNSRDAMPHGGRLRIETHLVKLDDSSVAGQGVVRPGEYAHIAVIDTGCGMTEEVKSKIFEPFYTTKDLSKGTGLGLAMVYGFISQSRGHISVESQPGIGTTVNIYLPICEEDRPVSRDLDDKEPAPSKGEHILLVEDEPLLRKFLQHLLEGNGYTVTAACNGHEALNLVQKRDLQPDLVLTDIVMPHLSGVQLVRMIKDKQPQAKAVYMSGYSGDSENGALILDSTIPFIHKPFSNSQLLEEIRRALGAAFR